MNKNMTVIVVVVVLILAAGAFLFLSSQKATTPAEPIQVIRDTSSGSSDTTTTTQTTPAESSPSNSQTQNTITISADGFSPSSITVPVGTTVTWMNNSGTVAQVDSDPHPAHTSYTPLNLGKVQNGATLELKFEKVGTYHYHNHLSATETGTVIVQ